MSTSDSQDISGTRHPEGERAPHRATQGFARHGAEQSWMETDPPIALRYAPARSGQPPLSDNPARIQPWFAVMGSSLLPALLSFYLPDALRLPLYIATGVMYVVACVMLYRQTKKTPRDGDS